MIEIKKITIELTRTSVESNKYLWKLETAKQAILVEYF